VTENAGGIESHRWGKRTHGSEEGEEERIRLQSKSAGAVKCNETAWREELDEPGREIPGVGRTGARGIGKVGCLGGCCERRWEGRRKC